MKSHRRFDLHRSIRAANGVTMPSMIRTKYPLEPDFAAVAALLGDRSRAAMLQSLADGRALPASDLARCAQVSAQTASTHLVKLMDGGLISVEQQGRHRYYRLRDERTAELLEFLASYASPTQVLPVQVDRSARELRFARTCYKHLAGRLGVAVAEALCVKGIVRDSGDGYELTGLGKEWLIAKGIEIEAPRSRPLTKRCLDWSERRYHLGGALGVALLHHFKERGWIVQTRTRRCLRLTAPGERALRNELGIEALDGMS
jgi:DNA-binding transcriptional ArsR family regulator